MRQKEIDAIKVISETCPVEMESVVKSKGIEDIYLNLGPDTNIPCYGINFNNKDGSRNTSLKL